MSDSTVKNMASQLSTGQAPNDVPNKVKEEDDRNYKINLGNLKDKFGKQRDQTQHYSPSYEVSYKTGDTSSKNMGDVTRSADAGTREEVSYETSFNRSKLNSLKGMFEAKNNIANGQDSKKPFVPDYTRKNINAPPAASASNNPEARDPNVVKTTAGEREVADYKPSVTISAARAMFSQTQPKVYTSKTKFRTSTNSSGEVVRNSDVVDDRPKELSTSLLSARAMFETGNSGNAPSKAIATWEGKDSSTSVLSSAKAKFASPESPKSPKSPTSELPKECMGVRANAKNMFEESQTNGNINDNNNTDEPIYEANEKDQEENIPVVSDEDTVQIEQEVEKITINEPEEIATKQENTVNNTDEEPEKEVNGGISSEPTRNNSYDSADVLSDGSTTSQDDKEDTQQVVAREPEAHNV